MAEVLPLKTAFYQTRHVIVQIKKRNCIFITRLISGHYNGAGWGRAALTGYSRQVKKCSSHHSRAISLYATSLYAYQLFSMPCLWSASLNLRNALFPAIARNRSLAIGIPVSYPLLHHHFSCGIVSIYIFTVLPEIVWDFGRKEGSCQGSG
jgi:hypothetical protein